MSNNDTSQAQELILWRIADKRHPILSGTGASLYGGRWNSPGYEVIYAATSYSLCILEQLAHISKASMPTSQVWVKIKILPSVRYEEANHQKIQGWNNDDLIASRDFGDQWIEERRTAVLLIPSIFSPPGQSNEKNAILNPHHPDFRDIQVTPPEPVVWDKRLFQSH